MKVWNPDIQREFNGKNVYAISEEEAREKLENFCKSMAKENLINRARQARSIQEASKIVLI